MAPRIEVASNAAATTWTDITAAVNLESLVVGGHAHEFEIGTGSGFDLDDDTAAAILPTRRQLRVWEDVPTPDVRLFQGRIVSVETGRGRRFDGNAVQHDVQLADQNQDLRGLQVDRWVRPAETDYTRAVAARNAFLHGSPRASTDLAMTYLPNTNTVTMPKKVYERTDPAGVFADLIGQSGKEGFLTQDGELFYDLPTSTAYSSSLAITDNSPNLTTEFPPMDGAGRSTDGTELYTGAILITPKGSRIGSTNRAAVETAHDVWRTVIADDDVTATNPIQALTAYLNEFAKDDLGYKCSVTLPASATDKIRPGMTINFRSSAAGVLAPIGVRIVRLMWRWAGLGFWIADLELDYPMKVNVKRPRGSLAATASIVTPLPGSVLTDGSLGLDPFADDVRPVPIVAALPTLPDVTYYPVGSTVSFTVDGKVYRNVGGVWVSTVPTSDLTGVIGIAQLTALVQEALADDPTNMLVNGGGEQGVDFGLPPGWTVGGGNAPFIHPTQRKYGSRSISFSNAAATDSYAYQDVTVAAGVTYVYSGWIKTGALPSGDSGWGALLNIDSVSAGAITTLETVGDVVNVNDVGLAATGAVRDWTFVQARVQFASAGTVRFYIQLGHGGGQSGDAWFDGLRFARESKVVADDIVAGAVTTLKLAAGSVTADKLTVGSNVGSLNAVVNGSFEDVIPGTSLPAAWATDYQVTGAGASYVRYPVAWGVHGVAILDVSCGTGSGGAVASKSFPVTSGDRWYFSMKTLSDYVTTNGLYFRIFWGPTEDFGGADSGVTFTDIISNGPEAGSGGWVKKEGYLTVPAGALFCRVALYNWLPNVSGGFYFDDVIAQKLPSGLVNSTAETIINDVGITVINGKISVANGASVVIIDGTSEMFRIVATGTISRTQANNGIGTSTTTLTGLGNLSNTPNFTAYLNGTGSAWASTEQGTIGGDQQVYGADTSGGSPTHRITAFTWAAHIGCELVGTPPANARIYLTVSNVTGANITIYGRFHVLTQTSI